MRRKLRSIASVAGIAALLTASALPMLAPPAAAAIGVVFTNSVFSYHFVPVVSNVAAEAQPDFSTAGWATGPGGFGTPTGCFFSSTVSTPWAAEQGAIVIRKAVELPAGARDVRLFGSIDGSAEYWINGTLFTSRVGSGCATGQLDDNISALIHKGTNVITVKAVQGVGHGFLDVGLSYLPPDAVPADPVQLVATSSNPGQVHLAWPDQPDADTWQVNYRWTGGYPWSGLGYTNERQMTVPALEPGRAYEFQVQGRNDYGTGPGTEALITVSSLGTPPLPPPPPPPPPRRRRDPDRADARDAGYELDHPVVERQCGRLLVGRLAPCRWYRHRLDRGPADRRPFRHHRSARA